MVVPRSLRHPTILITWPFTLLSAALIQLVSAAAATGRGVSAVTAAVANVAGVRELCLAIWSNLRAVLLGSMLCAAVASCWDDIVSTIRSLPRTLRAIAWVLQAGLSYRRFFRRFAGADPDSEAYLDALGLQHTRQAHLLLQICRRNGGLYVKAGQFAAGFGAVPREYRKVLAELEDRAVPRSYTAVRKVLLAQLGPDLDALFSNFDHHATAAASLAQVHKARLITGEEVAVKIQYPGLESSVGADLGTMALLSWAATWWVPGHQLGWLYQELEKKLAVELDFRNEVANAQRLRSILAESNSKLSVALPRIHPGLCTSKVITMEWIDGCKVTDIEKLKGQSINPRMVGILLVKLFGELMFVHGYTHGDPHPGNVMIRATGRKSFLNWLCRGSRQPFELVLLDHGTYVDVSTPLRQQFCQLWCALLMQDTKTSKDIGTQIGGKRGGDILPLLLTHRAKNRSEELALQKRVGVNGIGDMAQLLNEASNELKDMLRILTVIRGSSNTLGVSMADRLRIFGTFAQKGLPKRWETAPHIHRRFGKIMYRTRLAVFLLGLRSFVWSKAMLCRSWEVLSSGAEALVH